MYKLKHFIEWQAFGVCSAIGVKLGIATSRIRLWFIYISFLTFGSPVILYMVMAFWLNIKKYILNARRNPLKVSLENTLLQVIKIEYNLTSYDDICRYFAKCLKLKCNNNVAHFTPDKGSWLFQIV